ncbi:transposase [Providencia burhodogranariea]|uniref:Transposase n=1 Tax=Providencia burhodogranariea DSM 19968 TaxID=1141662 RepID=K8WWU7_9GAMM|nr:transposase [Providencia burhodogranariea DSM 19968]
MKRKSPQQYTEDFKKEAINLIVEQGYSVSQAAKALGVTTKLLYAWRQRHDLTIRITFWRYFKAHF